LRWQFGYLLIAAHLIPEDLDSKMELGLHSAMVIHLLLKYLTAQVIHWVQ
jgi:hypothetical protein